MAIIRLAREALRSRSDGPTLFECRDCGTSQFSRMDACPSCESSDIVEFSFE